MADRSGAPRVGAVVFQKESGTDIAESVFENVLHVHFSFLLIGRHLLGEHQVGILRD